MKRLSLATIALVALAAPVVSVATITADATPGAVNKQGCHSKKKALPLGNRDQHIIAWISLRAIRPRAERQITRPRQCGLALTAKLHAA